MPFHPFDVSVAHVAYASLGGFVVLFGMFSLFIREKLYIGEAIWAFLFGVVIGPFGGNVFNPRGWANGHVEVGDLITLEVSRVVLAIGVFAIGVELPKQYMKNHWKSLFFLLAPVMTWGWFVSAGLIFALVPALSFLSSLVIAACLTPTDPILAAAVVGGKYADKHVPAHLRHLLAAESGCNDGAAFPFLFIAIYLIIDATDGHAVEDWFLITWLYEVILGVGIGSILGIAFRHLMKFCERKDLIDRQSYVAQYVSLAMLTIGITTLLGSDDLLAAFASGTAFAWDGHFNKETEESNFSSVIDLLFNVAAFVYIGAWMPFEEFHSEELTLTVWRLLVIAILILLLRRLPAIIALYKWIPDIKTFREAVFSGHFGPMGVGAVFISTLAKTKLPPADSPTLDQVHILASSIEPVVAFMVLCSIVTHGLSIPFFSLGRRVHSVSRTWSRHQSIDPLPDWAAHTRHISRPEDVVINRDKESDVEKGNTDMESEKAMQHANENELPARSHLNDESHDNAPESKQEGNKWREGPDLIIERKNADDEVDVKVMRQVFSTSEETQTENRDATSSRSAFEETLAEPRQSSNLDSHNPDTQALQTNSSEASTPIALEEDWRDIDEPSNDEKLYQEKQPKSISPALTSNKSSKKRRNSFRRAAMTRNTKSHRARDSTVSQIEDHGRGRLTTATPRQTIADDTPSNSRVASIKHESRLTRTASPTRSIRWNDLESMQESSGLNSASNKSATPVQSRPPSPSEAETPKVQFDLPPTATRVKR